MRSIDAETLAALQAADTAGLIEADLVTFHVKTYAGVATSFAFWTEHDAATMDVISPVTGGLVSRTFFGAGAVLDVGEIALTADLSIRRLPIVLAQEHAVVASMWQGHNMHLAGVEVHRRLFDPDTRNLIGQPYVHFVGELNGGPKEVAPIGGQGGIRFDCVSDTRQLTRVNATRRSDAHQRSRQNDGFHRYIGVAGEWRIPWAQGQVASSGSKSLVGKR